MLNKLPPASAGGSVQQKQIGFSQKEEKTIFLSALAKA
jgi:hypothetical protein